MLKERYVSTAMMLQPEWWQTIFVDVSFASQIAWTVNFHSAIFPSQDIRCKLICSEVNICINEYIILSVLKDVSYS